MCIGFIREEWKNVEILVILARFCILFLFWRNMYTVFTLAPVLLHDCGKVVHFELH